MHIQSAVESSVLSLPSSDLLLQRSNQNPFLLYGNMEFQALGLAQSLDLLNPKLLSVECFFSGRKHDNWLAGLPRLYHNLFFSKDPELLQFYEIP